MLGRKNGRIQEGAKSGKNEKFGILYTRGVCSDRDEVVIRDFCRSHSLNKKKEFQGQDISAPDREDEQISTY